MFGAGILYASSLFFVIGFDLFTIFFLRFFFKHFFLLLNYFDCRSGIHLNYRSSASPPRKKSRSVTEFSDRKSYVDTVGKVWESRQMYKDNRNQKKKEKRSKETKNKKRMATEEQARMDAAYKKGAAAAKKENDARAAAMEIKFAKDLKAMRTEMCNRTKALQKQLDKNVENKQNELYEQKKKKENAKQKKEKKEKKEKEERQKRKEKEERNEKKEKKEKKKRYVQLYKCFSIKVSFKSN